MSEFDDLLARVRSGEAPSAPKQPDDIDYKSLLGQVRGKPDPSIAQATLTSSAYSNPDQEAEKIRLAREMKTRFGEDWSPMAIDTAEAKRRLAVEDGVNAMDKAPTLAAKMTDTSFANVAHDDLQNLSEMEQKIRKYYAQNPIKDPERTLLGTLGDIGVTGLKGSVGLVQALAVGPADIFTGGYAGKGLESIGFKFNETQKLLSEIYSAPTRAAIKKVGEAESIPEAISMALQNPSAIATTIGESVPQMLGGAVIGRLLLSAGASTVGAGMAGPALPSWMARAFGEKLARLVATAAGEGILGAGSAAEQIRGVTDDGLLSAKQSLAAVASGVGTAVFGFVGGKAAQKLGIADIDTMLVKGGLDVDTADVLKKGFTRSILEAGISEGVFEEMPQSAQEQMWQNFATDRPIGEGVENAMAMGMLAGFTTGGAIESVRHVSNRIEQARQKELSALKAEEFAGVLDTVNKLSEASKLRGRDTETAQAYFQELLDEGRPDVWITAQVFQQSGMAEKIAEAIPSVAQQLESHVPGTEIRLPIADLMAKMPGDELAMAILPHVSEEPGGFTQTTSKEFMESDRAKDLENEVARVIAGKSIDNTFKESQARVKEAALANMNAMGRFGPEKNEVDATIFASYMAVRGAQVGLNAEQFAARRQIAFSTQEVTADGQKYDQAGNLRTETPEFTQWFSDSKVVDAEGKPLMVYRGMAGENMPEGGVEEMKPTTGLLGTGVYMTGFTKRAEGYTKGENGQTYPLYVSIKNPITEDAFVERFGKGKKTAEESQAITDELIAEGYDGVISEHAPGKAWEVVAFNSNQVKSVFNKAPTESANILKQSDQNDLVITHNLSESNLMHAVKMGGIPVPSLAITHKNAPVEGFGEITLIGSEKLADPKGYAKTKVFGADIYSPRYPSIEYKLDKFALKRLNAELAPFRAEGEREVYGASISRIDDLTSIKAFKEYADAKVGHEATWNELKTAASQLLSSVGADEKIFQGYTYSGNRRYTPHTIENVVKILKKELRGGEGFNYGVGSLRAKFTPQFKSVAQIKKEKGRLVSKEAFDEIKKEIDEEFFALANTFGKNINLDTAIAILEDAPKLGIKRSAKQFDIELSDEAAMQAAEFLTRLKNLPTQYFEAKILREVGLNEFAGAVVPTGSDQAVFDALEKAGIKDIKTYEPGNQADRTAKIGEFDKLFFQGPRGQIAFGKDISKDVSVMSLFKGADLSTVQHELMHFFLESDVALASELVMQARMFGYDSLQQGERDILKDVSAMMNYVGITGTVEEQMDAWHIMSMEEKTPKHEKIAESFEHYLFSGKAPSIELQTYFQRIAAWMKSVYTSLKDFLAKHPDAGDLDQTVRAVFDRMLATTEQIQLAEQARSMMPLFTSPQQAGMTVEEFADYQSLDVDATREAIDELQARTLRDLAWVENAKGREIKKLQKEAAARRAEMSIEARREVMSQPVYRAWQFLTNKLTTEAKEALKSEPPRKSRAGSVDPSIDSLFVAIAKLGGLDKAQVASQWGWDSKERSPQPMFGQPLLRKEGGKSIDEMAQLLAGYRYLGFDTEGTYDLSEFEAKFEEEYRGNTQYSVEHDYEAAQGTQRAGEGVDLERIGSGRFDLIALKEMGFTQEMIDIIVDLKMTAKDGIHPDLVADEFDFTSGDELVRTLAIAEAPNVAIQQLTDQKMMERYGDLATPEAIEQAADQAIHNDARARFVATELNALAKATGSPKMMVAAAKNYAQAMIGKLLVRNLKPTQYASAEVRAAKAAQDAMAKGDTATAAAEKRNQLINNYATKAAYEAKADIDKAIAYFKRVQKPGKLPVTHYDQILSLLAKYDLKEKTLKSIDNVAAFRTWAKGQLDIGNIPPNVDALLTPEQRMQFQMQLNERNDDGELIYPNEEDQALLLASYVDQMPVRNYKEVSVEELLGLRDAIKQIEHIGRRTKKVLTDRKNREFDALVQEIKTHITEVAERTGRRSGDTRTPNDKTGQSLLSWRGFFFSHIKAANIIHVMDGESGGPLWESLMKTANDAANGEVLDLAEAHDKVQGMLAKLKGIGEITDRPKFFPTIDRSLNRQARIAMAMNLGNESNMQRLLGGEGWTMEQIKPVLDTLTTEDWNFVQGMWDYYETFRPRVGEMERLINGVEPKWVEARPIEVQTADGDTLNLRGGYAPVIFDPRASGRAASFAAEKDAKSMMQAARVASTVSKSFTKARVDEVKGRPLLLSLDGFIGGIQDTIHYLHWQPWIIDANRLVKAVDAPVREYYGAEVVKLLRDWTGDNAAGMKPARDAGERAITNLARNVSFVGLAYNVMSAVKQVTGYSQSVVVVGRKWFAKGIARSMASPRQAYLDAVEKSDFMKKRASTRMRDLAETRNTVQDQGKIREGMEKGGYAMMLFMQTAVDVPTWWAGYEKAIDSGHDEDMAVSLADQAVIDSQGGGLQKDLASVERATGAIRLLTGFMSFMNTTMNLNYRVLRSEATVGSKAIDLLLINTVPVLLSAMLGYLFTPGGEDKEPEDVAAGLLADQAGFLLGQMLGFREMQQIGYAAMGKPQGDYGGSAGTRIFSDMLKLAKQVGQGEMDDALRKAVVNAVSDFARLPGAQINRTITGAEAIYEGETMNPAALVFGYQKP